ncbi:MAG TPA: HAD family hydrolase [Chlorobaculum sp.]|nr:HAD family hydrolase [Chlorobaculum sp.]
MQGASSLNPKVGIMGIILLDIGNVVVTVDFLPFCKTVSRDGDSGARKVMNSYCEGDLKDRFDRGMISPHEFLGKIAADPLTVDMPLNELRYAWQNIFSHQPGAIEAIKMLQEHHSVWIMSDTDPLHFAFLINTFPVLRDLDRYFLSYEHGHLKRSPDAFRNVLERTGVGASEFTLIDDRPVNCAASRVAGINSIQFRDWHETLALLSLPAGGNGSCPNRSGA